MITKEKLDSWYTPTKLQIEYDGRYCSVLCEKKEVCNHKKGHAKTCKEIFDTVSFEERVRIIRWLSKNDFEDEVRELYDTHCSDCWGVDDLGTDDDGNEVVCHHVKADYEAAEADARWAERE